MKYSYVVFPDETEVTYSDPDSDGNVRVRIETPIDRGFKSLECILPSYTIVENTGYTDAETQSLMDFLCDNAHLILEYAAVGGFENAAAI
ncbi:MAG: hypothetical protein IKE03_02175 [Blautia sp.]|nr:hypothetical protein [Blautia sp.]